MIIRLYDLLSTLPAPALGRTDSQGKKWTLKEKRLQKISDLHYFKQQHIVQVVTVKEKAEIQTCHLTIGSLFFSRNSAGT